MSKKVRIGFVGVGGMGQCAHLRNYVALKEDCEVVALAEVMQNKGKLVAERYGIPKVYTDHNEMLANEELDGIVASQQFTRHGVVVMDLAKHGIPVFTEKPLAASLPVGEAIVKALEGSACTHVVGYHKRSDPATEYAKATIDELKESGELGKMKYVRMLMPAGDWIAGGFDVLLNAEDEAPDLEQDPAPDDMDEGLYGFYIGFVNYYIHQVNLIRHLLGEPYSVTYADPSGVLMVGASDSGVPCTLEMTPYSTSIEWEESALIAFEHGYVKLKLPAPLAYKRPGSVEILKDVAGSTPMVSSPHLPWVHAMEKQALNFIRFIRGEAPPMCEAAEALEDLKVARQYVRLRKGK
jgi:predicted dehydrogenase